MSEYQVGDLVRIRQGKVAHEVKAVIDTGRITTYDLVTVTGGRKGARHVGVMETRLNTWSDTQANL
jgi:alkylated DNA nucleotide flippase Atl1